MEEVSSNKIFNGYQKVFKHFSKELGCSMNFAIYLPSASKNIPLPVIYWLSGLTCNETNFIQKAGAQKYADEYKVIIVCPDTSPRDVNLPGDKESWDFGEGAGFYVNATKEPWSKHYKMYNYVTSELIDLVTMNFPVVAGKQSIMGHSMGGHGALICALKNPKLYQSVSAFAPICNPIQCPWGQKAFEGYFGTSETSSWNEWDATELIKTYNGPPMELIVDQGLDDKFYKDGQLLPENLMKACENSKIQASLSMRDGYDHSYYFIATFIEKHIKHHAKHLYA